MVETVTMESVLSLSSEESLKDKLLFEQLAADINALIQADFEKLVNLLYRIDVSEARLKEMLQANPNRDAGHIIAELLIERQLQKIKLRNEFGKATGTIAEDEKW